MTSEKIIEFINEDNKELEELIERYPRQIPSYIVAKYLGCHPDGLRAAIDEGFLGIKWKKPNKLTGGNCIPTGKFIRWVINMRG